ncbi:MAG: DUF3237 family protein [Sphingomonas fennica]
MAHVFVPPAISTRDLRGAIDLVFAFEIDLTLEPRLTEHTPHGRRIHQRITGGRISGPTLTGSVYPDGGGEFGLVRSDGIEELFSRLMLRAADGEWLYTHLNGYVRPDGYARFQAVFDADRQGPHGWLNESMFIGTIASSDGSIRRMTYFEAR